MVLTKRQLEKKNNRKKHLDIEIRNIKTFLITTKNELNTDFTENEINEYNLLYNKNIDSKNEIINIEQDIKKNLNNIKNLPNKLEMLKKKEYNIWINEINRIDAKIQDNKELEFNDMLELDFNKFSIEEELNSLIKELNDSLNKLSKLSENKRFNKRDVLTAFTRMRKENKENCKKKIILENDIINVNEKINEINKLIIDIPKKERIINNNYYKLIDKINEEKDRLNNFQFDIDKLIQKQSKMNIENDLYLLLDEKENINNLIQKLMENKDYNIMNNLKELKEEHNDLIAKKEWYEGKKKRLNKKIIEFSTENKNFYNNKINILNDGINEFNNVKSLINSLKKRIKDHKISLEKIVNDIESLRLKLNDNNNRLEIERNRANERINIMNNRINDMKLNEHNIINNNIIELQQKLSYTKLKHYNIEQQIKNIINTDNYKKYIKIIGKIKQYNDELYKKNIEYKTLTIKH